MPTFSSDAAVQCAYCGEIGQNSYWLLDHLEHCPERWHHHHHHHRRHETKFFSYTVEVPIDPHRKQVHIHMADLTVKDSDAPATVTVALSDAQGNPTQPDYPVGDPSGLGPTWAEDSNGTVLTLAPSADGLSATLAYKAPGVSNLTFSTTDNDGTKIIATGSVQVDAGEAVRAQLTFQAGVNPPPGPAPTP